MSVMLGISAVVASIFVSGGGSGEGSKAPDSFINPLPLSTLFANI